MMVVVVVVVVMVVVVVIMAMVMVMAMVVTIITIIINHQWILQMHHIHRKQRIIKMLTLPSPLAPNAVLMTNPSDAGGDKVGIMTIIGFQHTYGVTAGSLHYAHRDYSVRMHPANERRRYLQCDFISHWLGAYTERSLHMPEYEDVNGKESTWPGVKSLIFFISPLLSNFKHNLHKIYIFGFRNVKQILIRIFREKLLTRPLKPRTCQAAKRNSDVKTVVIFSDRGVSNHR